MHALPSDVPGAIEPGDDVLVLCRSFAADEPAACLDLLTLGDPGETNVLYVSFTQSPDDCCATWDRHADATPEEVKMIAVTDEPRSPALHGETPPGHADGTPCDPAVEAVISPSDLTTLGVRITDCLDALETTPDTRTAVCFESVSILLQYADRQQVSRFLHALTDHPATAGSLSHYHMDPAAHDEETVQMLREPFDAVCTYEDGAWTFRRQSRVRGSPSSEAATAVFPGPASESAESILAASPLASRFERLISE